MPRPLKMPAIRKELQPYDFNPILRNPTLKHLSCALPTKQVISVCISLNELDINAFVGSIMSTLKGQHIFDFVKKTKRQEMRIDKLLEYVENNISIPQQRTTLKELFNILDLKVVNEQCTVSYASLILRAIEVSAPNLYQCMGRNDTGIDYILAAYRTRGKLLTNYHHFLILNYVLWKMFTSRLQERAENMPLARLNPRFTGGYRKMMEELLSNSSYLLGKSCRNTVDVIHTYLEKMEGGT